MGDSENRDNPLWWQGAVAGTAESTESSVAGVGAMPPKTVDEWLGLSQRAQAEDGVPESQIARTTQAAHLTAEICFIAADGSEDSSYYSSLQGMRIRGGDNRHLRVFLPHVVMDIESTDAKTLRRLIYAKAVW